MFCPKCGSAVADDSSFCQTCGRPTAPGVSSPPGRGPGGATTGRLGPGRSLKGFSPALFLVAVICFFLPFVEVSCRGQIVARHAGLDLAAGPEVRTAQGVRRAPPSLLVSGAFACALAAGISAVLANRKNRILSSAGTVLGAVFGFFGGLALLLYMVVTNAQVSTEAARQGLQSLLFLHFLPAFWLALALLLAGGVILGNSIKLGRREAAAGAASTPLEQGAGVAAAPPPRRTSRTVGPSQPRWLVPAIAAVATIGLLVAVIAIWWLRGSPSQPSAPTSAQQAERSAPVGAQAQASTPRPAAPATAVAPQGVESAPGAPSAGARPGAEGFYVGPPEMLPDGSGETRTWVRLHGDGTVDGTVSLNSEGLEVQAKEVAARLATAGPATDQYTLHDGRIEFLLGGWEYAGEVQPDRLVLSRRNPRNGRVTKDLVFTRVQAS